MPEIEFKYLRDGNSARVPAAFRDRIGPIFYYATELAVEDDDGIVGALTYDFDAKKILNVYQIQVLDSYRRQGIGFSLLQAAIRRHRPRVVVYPYDTPEGKRLAEQTRRAFPNVRFEIHNVDD